MPQPPHLRWNFPAGRAWWIKLAVVAVCCAIYGVPATLLPIHVATAAEVAFPEPANETRVYLKRVDTLLASGQRVEALENLRRVIDAAGNTIIEVESPHAAAGFRCYLPLRLACQMKLAGWHDDAPELLERYRAQVDAVAERGLADALEKGDEGQLRELVDRYFCSSVGDDALFWLGEFAFQRGDHDAARIAWERIHPSFRWSSDRTRFDRYTGLPTWLVLRDIDLQQHWDLITDSVTGRTTGGRWLAYPDTDLDLAKVRARLVLTSIVQGQRERSAIELEILRRVAPAAAGRLGGRQGNFVDRLQELIEESGGWPPHKPEADWPTLGGNSRRGRQVARDIDVGGGPIWDLALPLQSWLDPVHGANRLRIGEAPDRLLSFHPIVIHGQVLVVTDVASVDVRAVDLQSGELAFQSHPEPTPPATYDNRQSRTVPRFTMTGSGDRLFACVTGRDPERLAGAPAGRRSRMIAIDLRAEGRLSFDIQLEAPAWRGDWAFEGAPLCHDARLYVAVRRLDAFRPESHLACFDARNGRLCWRRFICAAQSLATDNNDLPNNLLALDEGVLFYNTNAGAVAAVAAEDGAIQWVAAYPRAAHDPGTGSGVNAAYRFRDLNPCLVQDGLVYVAPADCARLFALDAATGQFIWTTPEEIGSDIVHLLGAGQGRLIGSGEGLYWFDAYNGRLETQVGGGFQPAEGHARREPRGHGRGLLADKNVYWPTRDAIFVFSQRPLQTETGWQPVLVREIDLASRRAVGGNLVLVDGVLVIASGDRLYAFNESGIPTHAAD